MKFKNNLMVFKRTHNKYLVIVFYSNEINKIIYGAGIFRSICSVQVVRN